MIRFTNRTTKEDFVNGIEWRWQTINPVESDGNFARSWDVADRFENEWKITFTGKVNEFTISNDKHTKPFILYLILIGDKVEIHKAIENGRNIKSDRLLRKYTRLADMVSCYHRFGYLKI
jgi:hypothetical protein